MTSKVVYTGDLRTMATHLRSGSTIETDAPVDNQGKGERFSPTDLVATALASCIVTTMAILGKVHEISVDGVECQVEKIMAANPRRIGEIKIEMDFSKCGPYTDREKTMLQHIAHNCPVGQTLHPDCKQVLVFNW
jgi:putative redox protein